MTTDVAANQDDLQVEIHQFVVGAPKHVSADGGRRPNTTPSKRDLEIWRGCDYVCFDIDCTITVDDTLDRLAEHMGVADAVTELTKNAMDGSISLQESLDDRLKIINCKPADIAGFVKDTPPESRFTPGIESLIKCLQERGVVVFLLTGGFREMAIPIAERLNVPLDRLYANRMLWGWDDVTFEPSRLVGFDLKEPTGHNLGKVEAIARIRETSDKPVQVVMIGDGITDLEAIQGHGGADLFIGYGGVKVRPTVEAEADWYVMDYQVLQAAFD